jgi:hypothetical protein
VEHALTDEDDVEFLAPRKAAASAPSAPWMPCTGRSRHGPRPAEDEAFGLTVPRVDFPRRKVHVLIQAYPFRLFPESEDLGRGAIDAVLSSVPVPSEDERRS